MFRYSHDDTVRNQLQKAKRYKNIINTLVELEKQYNSLNTNTFQNRRARNYLKQKIEDIRNSIPY